MKEKPNKKKDTKRRNKTMSQLINGKTRLTDMNALARALARLLQDEKLTDRIMEMIQAKNTELHNFYDNQTKIVDFLIERNHPNFNKAFGHSYTDIGFQKQSDGTINLICENPQKICECLMPEYTKEIINDVLIEENLMSRIQQNYNDTVITLYR